MENLVIEDLRLDTLSNFKECFDKNGSYKKIENLKWQFLDNPEAMSFVDIAVDNEANKTAGIYAVSCIMFEVGGVNKLGAQSLDTITDVDYRGTGLFINLANDVYEKASKKVSLVYGFPNGNSIKGFKKRLKWQVLDPLPFLIKPLRSRYFTNRIKWLSFLPNINLSPFAIFNRQSQYSLKEEKFFPAEVNNLWENFSAQIKVSVKRDKTYLDWRYIQKPNEEYKIVHCYDKKEYLGFVVYVVKEKHDGKIGYIMELVYNLASQTVGKTLLNYAISKIKEEGADCILSWCLEHSPNYKIFKKGMFFNFPEKLRPIELHFGARSFNTELNDLIYDRNSWYISYSDSDTV